MDNAVYSDNNTAKSGERNFPKLKLLKKLFAIYNALNKINQLNLAVH